MEPPIQVNSEIGRLKTVLLHRPGEELEALTPDYMARMLFDDVPYLKIAQAEHDAFANVLRENGVEVLYLDKLAAEALATQEVRERFIVEMARLTPSSTTYKASIRSLWFAKSWPALRKAMSKLWSQPTNNSIIS